MAHVKIYGRRDVWQDRRGSVSDAVHRAVVGTWGLPPEKRFHRFLLLDADDLVAPRSKEYLVVEILCFTGRSVAGPSRADRRVLRRRRTDARPGRRRPRGHHHREPAARTGASAGSRATSCRWTTASTSERLVCGTSVALGPSSSSSHAEPLGHQAPRAPDAQRALAVGDAELQVDRADLRLHGVPGDVQRLGDLAEGQGQSEVRQDDALPLGQGRCGVHALRSAPAPGRMGCG